MTGHRPSYLRRVVNIAVANNYRVVVAMPAPCFEHQVVKELFKKYDPDSLSGIRSNMMNRISEPTNPLLILRNEYRCVRFYRTALKEAQVHNEIDLVLIGMLDDAAMFTGIAGLTFGDTPWLGIVMRQKFHLTPMGAKGPPDSKLASLKKRLFLRLLRRNSSKSLILTIDKLLLYYIRQNYADIGHAIAHIPDAVDDRGPITNPNIRQELGIPDEAFVVMIYGALRDNKGIRLLVDAMCDLPETIHVMLVGPQNSQIRAYLQQESSQHFRKSGRLHQVDRYIDVTEDPNFFSAADLIWVGYRNYYSMSAVLVQAAQYERPTLTTDAGLVGWLTNEYKTGLAIDTSHQHEIVKSLNDVANNRFAPTREQYAALVEEHDLATFENALISGFNRLLV